MWTCFFDLERERANVGHRLEKTNKFVLNICHSRGNKNMECEYVVDIERARSNCICANICNVNIFSALSTFDVWRVLSRRMALVIAQKNKTFLMVASYLSAHEWRTRLILQCILVNIPWIEIHFNTLILRFSKIYLFSIAMIMFCFAQQTEFISKV